MSVLLCATREDSDSIEGKSRVYFTCSPNDFDKYFDSVCREILDAQDCLVYFKADPASGWEDREDMESNLAGMQLFVVPITYNLFSADEPNVARYYELPFADEHGIPILGIICEEGLDSIFTESYENGIFIDQTDIAVTHDPELFETQFKMDIFYLLSDGNINPDDVKAAAEKYRRACDSLLESGNSYMKEADLRMAEQTFKELLSIAASWVMIDDESDINKFLIQSYINLGHIYFYKQNLGKAEDYVNKGLNVIEAMGEYAHKPEYYALQVSCYEELGDIQNAKGNCFKAYDYYGVGIDIIKSSIDTTNDIEWGKTLTTLYNKQGDAIMKGAPNKGLALGCYFAAREQCAFICEETQYDFLSYSGMAYCDNKIGDVYVALDRFDDAKTCYQEGLNISEELYKASSSAPSLERIACGGLSKGYYGMGIASVVSNLDEGIAYFKACQKFRELLYETANATECEFPELVYGELYDIIYHIYSKEQTRNDLSECYDILSKLLHMEGHNNEAETYEQKVNNLNGN